MAIKLARVVTYHEGILPTNLHDTLIRFSCKIMRQAKNISHYQVADSLQISQSGNLPRWANAHKVT